MRKTAARSVMSPSIMSRCAAPAVHLPERLHDPRWIVFAPSVGIRQGIPLSRSACCTQYVCLSGYGRLRLRRGLSPLSCVLFLVCGMGRGLSSTRAAAGRALTPTSGDIAIDALVAIKPVWPRSLQIKYTILRTVADADQIHPWHADEVVRRQQPGCKIAIDAEWAEMIGKILDAVSAETPFKFVAAAPGETADLLATQTCFAAHGPQAEVRSPIYHNLNRMQFDAREDLPGLLQEQIDSPLRGVNLLQFDPQKFRAGPGAPGSEAWWGIQHEVLHTLGLLDTGALPGIKPAKRCRAICSVAI